MVPKTDHFDQYIDRLMELSLTQTPVPDKTTTGSYFVNGSYGIDNGGTFKVILFETATTYVGTSRINYVFGMAQVDNLWGGRGNDVLNDGDALDRLRGGTGNHACVFDSALDALSIVDAILDCGVTDDRIWQDDAVFTALTAAEFRVV